jgi:adenine-specific DNA methylase
MQGVPVVPEKVGKKPLRKEVVCNKDNKKRFFADFFSGSDIVANFVSDVSWH